MTLLKKKFLAFHYRNPELWYAIDKFALERVHQGFKHYAIASVVERARWHTDIPTKGGHFKIDNAFRAFYARLWHLTHPKYKGFFHTRDIPDDHLPDCDDYRQLSPGEEPPRRTRVRRKAQ